MLKLLFMCILMSAFSLSKGIHLRQPELSRAHVEIRERLSAIVAVESHLYTIFYNASHLIINSTDNYYRACIFPTDAFSNNRIFATVLKSKRRFVVWSIYRSEIHNKTVEVQTTMYLVDPWLCNYKNIPLSNDYHPRWYQRVNLGAVDYPHEPQVVAYNDSFDVFYSGPNVCSPCRFNVAGEEIKMHTQIEPDRFDAMEASYLQDVNLPNGTRGYFQVYRYVNFTADIRLLDHNFKVLRQIHVRHMISLIDVEKGEDPAIVVCYLSRYPQIDTQGDLKYVYCKKYDTELDRLFTVRLPMAVETYPAGFSLTVDHYGHMFVTYEAPYGNSTKLALFQYDVEGNLTKSLDFSRFNGKKKIAKGAVLTDREYCLISSVRPKDRETSSCFNNNNKVIECIYTLNFQNTL